MQPRSQWKLVLLGTIGISEQVAGERSQPAPYITPQLLGSEEFRADYRVKYAYVAGAMFKGIASQKLVVAMGRAGLIGFLGAGGLELDEIESAVRAIQSQLQPGFSYGVNLLCNVDWPIMEDRTAELYLKLGVRHVEAAAYMVMTSALVRLRLKGIARNAAGNVVTPIRLLAKVSRLEVAEAFMQPAPESIVRRLCEAGKLSSDEAELCRHIPMCDDVCVESDSGGHTDRGVAYSQLPAIIALRDSMMLKYRYTKKIRVGAAGGIGTPHAAAAAFIMGADFILTGSINQCTVEAGTSDSVKDLLQEINVHDTAYAPAGDMFELGAKVQVVKKGVFFPARANRLYDIYQQHNSLDEIDPETSKRIQEKYFGRSFAEVWKETKAYYERHRPLGMIEQAERNPKHKMALIFKWYFMHSIRLAMQGSQEHIVDYQIHCGPALGAFNQWVKGTRFENWRSRRVAEIADLLMQATAELLNSRFQSFASVG